MKKIFFIMLVVVVCAGFAQAKEKQYVDVEGQKYLRCQPVQDYYGKASGGTVGSASDWWIIKMSPAAVWNAPSCAARGDELLFSAGKPVKNKICNNPIVAAKQIASTCVSVQLTCDEGVFGGRVPAAVLRVRPEGSAAIELHFRPGKAQPYKAKRGFVKTDGRFYPETWPNGSCMVKRSVNPMTNVNMTDLLHSGETLMQIMEKDGKTPFTDHGGGHDTTALYRVTQ